MSFVTIREHLKQRFRWGVIAAVVSFVLLIGIVASADGNPGPFFLIGFIPFMGAVLYMNFAVRCPKCGGNLGLTIAHFISVGSFGLSKHQASYCPFCGTQIDEEIGQGKK